MIYYLLLLTKEELAQLPENIQIVQNFGNVIVRWEEDNGEVTHTNGEHVYLQSENKYNIEIFFKDILKKDKIVMGYGNPMLQQFREISTNDFIAHL